MATARAAKILDGRKDRRNILSLPKKKVVATTPTALKNQILLFDALKMGNDPLKLIFSQNHPSC